MTDIPLNGTIEVLQFIAFDTFSSIWYWAAVIVAWAAASNWLIGVPFDVLYRARKYDPARLAELEALVAINVRRIIDINALIGVPSVAMAACILSALTLMALWYGFELALGLLLLAAPLTLIVAINMHLAYRLHYTPLTGRVLVKLLFTMRLWTHIIAMIALFLTSLIGAYQLLQAQSLF